MDASTFSYIDPSWAQAQDCSSVIETISQKLDMREMLNETIETSEARKLINELTDLKNEYYSYLKGDLIAEDKYDSVFLIEDRDRTKFNWSDINSNISEMRFEDQVNFHRLYM